MQLDEVEDRATKSTDRILFILIISYLFVRVIIITWLQRIFKGTMNDWMILFIEFIMYLITVMLFIFGRRNLSHFNIDKLSFVLFILFGTLLRTSSTGNFSIIEIFFYFMFFSVTIYLIVKVRLSGSELKRWEIKDLKWILIGIAVGIGFSLLIATPRYITSQFTPDFISIEPQNVGQFIMAFVHSFGHSSIMEEPVFRGFLWGYLRNRGWNSKWIWLTQAGLFWLAHLRYIDRTYTFWFTVPVSGLLLGWLAWKSRSITPSMITHTLYNATSVFF
jgi:membrane protease YdiL (CAAX protease family)